jgi:hypothetical protein
MLHAKPDGPLTGMADVTLIGLTSIGPQAVKSQRGPLYVPFRPF